MEANTLAKLGVLHTVQKGWFTTRLLLPKRYYKTFSKKIIKQKNPV